MKLLLDTHALLWALEGSSKLSKAARRAIESPRNDVLVSAASAWEIAIKQSIGRLQVPSDLEEAVDAAGFVQLPIGFADASRLATLPLLHGDPFDRILVAQALEQAAAIVSRDEAIARYPVRVLW